MAISVGSQLGMYEITALIGEGGMGRVFRARDTKLGRDVALKVLPDAWSRDPERLARIEREAQVLASLNHPHIAAIHHLEQRDGATVLVMEFVPGLTLAERFATSANGRPAGPRADAAPDDAGAAADDVYLKQRSGRFGTEGARDRPDGVGDVGAAGC